MQKDFFFWWIFKKLKQVVQATLEWCGKLKVEKLLTSSNFVICGAYFEAVPGLQRLTKYARWLSRGPYSFLHECLQSSVHVHTLQRHGTWDLKLALRKMLHFTIYVHQVSEVNPFLELSGRRSGCGIYLTLHQCLLRCYNSTEYHWKVLPLSILLHAWEVRKKKNQF